MVDTKANGCELAVIDQGWELEDVSNLRAVRLWDSLQRKANAQMARGQGLGRVRKKELQAKPRGCVNLIPTSSSPV